MSRSIVIFVMILMVSGMAVLAAGERGASAGQPAQAKAGAALRVQLTGVLNLKQGKYVLTDDKSHVTHELRGPSLKKYCGSKVVVEGRAVPKKTRLESHSPVILVSFVKATTASVATGGATVATAAAVSTGVSSAVIGGIAAGAATVGTVGGLYAANVIGSNDQPVSRP